MWPSAISAHRGSRSIQRSLLRVPQFSPGSISDQQRSPCLPRSSPKSSLLCPVRFGQPDRTPPDNAWAQHLREISRKRWGVTTDEADLAIALRNSKIEVLLDSKSAS